MKVKCRGFEGELIRLEKCAVFDEMNGTMNIAGYSVKMSNDIGRVIEIHGAYDSEIEFLPSDYKLQKIRDKKFSVPPGEIEKMKERYRFRG